MTTYPAIDRQRFLKRLDDFAAIGATPAGGVNRQALSEEDRQARRELCRLAQARGFKVFQDPMANLFIRREGRNSAPPLVIGSHLDSQPTGGRFDGALGTLAAFEVLEALEDQGVETALPLEVVAWTNEEGSRFAPGTMGSMAFALGTVPEEWEDVRDRNGARLMDELKATLASLPQAESRPLGFPISGYLELHIEQGPSLEWEKLPIGIVHGIQGTRWLEVAVSGQAAHAGTTALSYRRDPMTATAAALDRLFRTVMPSDERARLTVGRIEAKPGSVNAIPESVEFTIDLRHPDAATLDELEAMIGRICKETADEARCEVKVRRFFDMPPVSFPESLLGGLENAAERQGFPWKRMLSGAFHDALFVSRVAPAAMIFVPCRDGLSHNEREHVEPEHSAAGAQMLLASTLEVMELLAGQGASPGQL